MFVGGFIRMFFFFFKEVFMFFYVFVIKMDSFVWDGVRSSSKVWLSLSQAKKL